MDTETQKAIQIAQEDMEGFAIEPKKDCPHIKTEWGYKLKDEMEAKKKEFVTQPCVDCQNVGENWVCLECGNIFCSRYVKEHMVTHNQSSKHPIALSFSDGSFWCYDCDSYITSPFLDILRKLFAGVKFKEVKELEALFEQLNLNLKQQNSEEEQSNTQQQEESKSGEQEQQAEEDEKSDDDDDKKKFTRESVLQGIKDGKYKKVAFLTGAGISVAAGIPDFRTPGTGLYSQLEKYNLPFPEAIFEINFFKKNPQPFYTLAKEFLTSGMQPTIAHHLITEFNKHNLLSINLSQNIDGLEYQAGVPDSKLIQAHGHFRTAHCIKCQKEYPMSEFKKNVEEDTILHCECGSLVKPDIVFFGEELPSSFYKGIQALKSCDLVFVMGTSLTVSPFCALISYISTEAPIMLMNMTNPLGDSMKNLVYIHGDLEDNSSQFMRDMGWEVPQIERKEIKVEQKIQKVKSQ